MRDDEFDKAMETWAEAEVESAPDLHPTPEMVRMVQAKQDSRRAFPVSSPWVMAGTATAGLILVVALLALLHRSGVLPGRVPRGHETLVAQRPGPDAIEMTVAPSGGKGKGEKGRERELDAFRQLVLQVRRHDSPVVQAIDLSAPPEEALVLGRDDSYRLVLELAEERHTYVYQSTSSGGLVQLLPSPAYGTVTNPVQPGKDITVPAEPNWLYLDGLRGEQHLYIVTSTLPLQELDDLYSRYNREGDAATRRENLSALQATLDLLVGTPSPHAGAVEFVFRGE
jgi:hypothetical protein